MSRVVLAWADRTNTGKILASGVGTADAKSTRREGAYVRSLTRTSEVGVGNRRTVILIAAVVVAVIAAVAIYSYLNNVQNRAYHNAKLVKVFRVAKDIKKGLPGEQAVDGNFVKSDDIPQKFRPTTALTDINTIRTVSGGLAPLGSLGADPIGALLYERRYSLLWEGHRWNDMRRYGRLSQLPLDLPSHFVAKVMPIPKQECDARNTPTQCQ